MLCNAVERSISLFRFPVASLLPPAVWLSPIKLSLQAAQLPNTFKSHKIQQSTIPYQAKTLHLEAATRARREFKWWQNGPWHSLVNEWRKLQMIHESNAYWSPRDAPRGMLGELGSLLGLRSKQFGWMMSPAAAGGEKCKHNLTLRT